jgi:hypothetical protein|tara:strand:+ start:508 stop:1992 length:1485 start_codon:yes stop_codon:yes gene_type:complete
MAVGFGYIRDDKPTQVDWGQITRDANDALKSIEKDRQGRRDKIEEDQKEFTKMLMERPMGGDTVYQQLMGNYTTMISKAMLDKMNQLKRGDITEQDFTTFRGTVTSGATGMMAGAKAYVEGFDTSAELATGDGSALTNWGNAKNQRLFSLEGITPMVDPVSGETTFFVLNEDGEKEVVDMSQFLRRSVNKQTAFDTKGAIDTILDVKANTFEDDLGGIVSGKLLVEKEIKDAEGKVIRKEVVFDEEFVRKQAQASVQQNTHVFDILVKDVTGYDIQALPTEYYNLQTKEERDAYMKELQQNTSVLYVDNNDNPIVSDAQRKEAEDYIVEQVKGRSEFSKKEKAYKAKRLIDLDIQWRDASIAATNAEANRAGKSRTLPAIRGYARGFFPTAGLTPENIESTIVSAFQNFDYRDIKLTRDESGKATIQYKKPDADKPTTVNFNLSDDAAELQVLLGELLIRQRGFDQIVEDAIIAGALDDTQPPGGAGQFNTGNN